MPTDLVKILKDRNLVNEVQLFEIRKQTAGKEDSDLERFLVKNRIISEEELLKVKSDFFHISVIDLEGKTIPREVLDLIPKELAVSYKVVAFEKKDNTLKVAILDPGNLKAREAIDFIARQGGLELEYFTTSLRGIEEALRQYGSLAREVSEVLKAAKPELASMRERRAAAEGDRGAEEFEEMIKTAPVSKMTSVILRYAVEGRASDIHIEPFQDESRVRYRIDGSLRTSITLPKYVHSAIVSRIKVLSNLKIDETRIPQDGRIRQEIDGRAIDFRVSTMPLVGGEKVVMRILETSAKAPSFEELGFSGERLAVINKNIEKPNGIFLVTGPTGSGKSTTLFSALNVLNKEDVNIATLEDPVEYYVDGVSQSQVNPDVGFTFASGLRAILRQDPDIIMVGEIRDTETGELAVHAGLTGHVVLSTLHTNDAFGAVPRLIDMKVQPFLLASALNLVIAQRLGRRICQNCRETVDIPQNLKELVKKYIDDSEALKDYRLKSLDELVFYKGKGCPRCGNQGYQGRIAIFEILEVTQEMRQIIAKGCSPEEVHQELKRQEMISMRQDGILKSLQGLVTLEDVLAVTS